VVDVRAGKPDVWQSPWWLRVFAPLGWLLIAALVLERRGWILAVVVLLLLAPVGLPVTRVLRWFRRRARLDAAYLGPVLFAVLMVVTQLPIWVCTAAGLGAGFLGLMLGAMRGFAHG
jgi:hypothetical protein